MAQSCNLRAAAEGLGVSDRFVRRLVFQHRLPHLRVARWIRVRHDNLTAFVDACRIEPGGGRE